MTEQIPDIDPAAFATMIKGATDEQLTAGLDSNADMILGEIFRRMPEQVRGDRVAHIDAVIEWRIAHPAGAEARRWQLTVKGGACTLQADGQAEPTMSIETSGVDFLRLVSGAVQGPELFLTGRLKIQGDLMLASQLPTLFTMPTGTAS
jgi:putative sterol carrier protein